MTHDPPSVRGAVVVSSSSCRHLSFHALATIAISLGAWISSVPAVAAPYTIERLYSNQPGDFQYIVLRESSPDRKPASLAGITISVKSRDTVKRFVIPSDPPAAFPAGGALLLATPEDLQSFEPPGVPLPPDYRLPIRFLPTNGGTIDIDGGDAWTFGPLPIDGSTALLRSGETVDAASQSYVGGPFAVGGGFTPVIEYYNAELDHYFMTASEPDIDAIESGRVLGWKETGLSIPALTSPRPDCCVSAWVAVPVCRFYIPPQFGNSHFLSAAQSECAEVAQKFPGFVLETDAAFYVNLPDLQSGECLRHYVPVYRLWNQRADANHRYVMDAALRDQLRSMGWLSEGYGPDGVAWCI